MSLRVFSITVKHDCVKRLLTKGSKIGFQDRLSLNAGQKYCRMLRGEHSAILSTFIKLPFVIKIWVLFIFDWPFYTGFTVYSYTKNLFCIFQSLEYCPSDINVVPNNYISGLGGMVIVRASAMLYDGKPTSYAPSEYCPSDINVVPNVYISGLGGTASDQASATLCDDKPTSYAPSEDLDRPVHQPTYLLVS